VGGGLGGEGMCSVILHCGLEVSVAVERGGGGARVKEQGEMTNRFTSCSRKAKQASDLVGRDLV
jgi:hypothetical protein